MKQILAIALGVALFAPACSDPAAPATPTPVAATISETFTGTLLPLATDSHSFTVNQVGRLQVTLNGVTPGAAVGVGVGTPSGAHCLLIDNLTAVASSTVQLSGTATIAGTFCVAVFDVGNLVESVSYTVTVQHS